MKSNNPRLSYSDIKIVNLGAVPTMDVTVGGLQKVHGLRGPITHPYTKFQQNPIICGWVIFGESPTRCFSEVSGRTTPNWPGHFNTIRRCAAELLRYVQFSWPGFQWGQFWTAYFTELGSNQILRRDRSVIDASNAPFRLQVCCFISKSERQKLDWVENLGTFTPGPL